MSGLTVEKMAEELNAKIDAFKSQVEQTAKESAKASELEAMKEQLKTVVTKEDLNKLSEEFNQLRDRIVGEGEPNTKKGYFVEFVEKNISEKLYENAKHSAKLKVKARDVFGIVKEPALMTTANVVPNATNGFNQLFGNYIDTTIYETPKRDPFILSLVDVTTQPGTEAIWYVERKNEEGDAEFIGEGDAKPLADAEWVESKAPIKEVALFWKFTNRSAKHAPAVVQNFRTHAQELVELKIDEGVYSGDGTDDELKGLTEFAVPFVVPTQLAGFYSNANIWDAIMAMATKIRLGNFKGNITAILNPVWEAKMAGYKNSSGDYIIPPFVSPDGKRVGSVRVEFNNGVPDDEITVGILDNFKVVIAEDIEYYEGYENDDFRKNLQSKKLEAFLGTYLPSNLSGSIIHDDIATVLSQIEEATPSA